MSPGPEPRWDRIDDPVAFFELSEPLDRRQLKRAYTRLIRRYKPERFPREFQRIRACYETLEAELRHGRPSQRTAAPTPSPLTPPTARAAAPSLAERVQREPARALYEELLASERTGFDRFIALATLADVVATSTEPTFEDWLFEGLRKDPSSPQIIELLHEHCRQPTTRDRALEWVERIAAARPNSFVYGFITDSLWRFIVREIPFAQWRDVHERCAQHQRDCGLGGRLILALALVRQAMFSADSDWIEAQRAFIAPHFQQLGERFEYDLEVLDLLDRYRAVRGTFLAGDDPHAARIAVDQVVQSWAMDEPTVLDRTFLQWQVATRDAPEALLEACPHPLAGPTTDPQTLAAAWNAMLFLRAEVTDRTRERHPEFVMSRVREATDEFMRTLDARRRRSILGLRSLLARGGTILVGALALFGAALGAVVVCAGLFAQTGVGVPGTVVAAVGCVIGTRATFKARAWHQRVAARFRERWYLEVERRASLEFLVATRYPLGAVIESIPTLRPARDRHADWKLREDALGSDFGLTLCNLAFS